MRKILSILILVLIISIFVILIGVLYSGGLIDVAGIRITRVNPATFVITLCFLIPIYVVFRKAASLKDGLAENTFGLLIYFVLILYFGNYRTLGASDTIPARYLPLSILREGDFDLDEFADLHGRPASSGMVYRETHLVSSYPVGASVLASPFYLPSAIGPMPGNSRFVGDLEKFAAAFIVVLSVIVLYFAVLRLTTHRMALLITIVYALATSSFSVSSQALWQHRTSPALSGSCIVLFGARFKRAALDFLSGISRGISGCVQTNGCIAGYTNGVLCFIPSYEKNSRLFVIYIATHPFSNSL